MPSVHSGGRPRVGVVGGGQLARMLAQAAVGLDCEIRVLARRRDEAAALVVPDVVAGPPDLATLAVLAEGCDVVTFDHELVDPEVISALSRRGIPLRPGPRAMRVGSDKVLQRRVAEGLGIPVPPHRVVSNRWALREAVDAFDAPVVVKAGRGGYDGRGVHPLTCADDIVRLPLDLVGLGQPALVEPHLDLDAELAVLVARRPGGEMAIYPVVRTHQRDGICTTVTAPADLSARLWHEATEMARRLADALEHVGVLAVELFVVGGELLLNELAPRTHNSGHLSIDACVTSQFENHLRAILDLPLGDPTLIAPAAAMANVIADGTAPLPLAVPLPPGARVHRYGKRPWPGRKVGHVTVTGDDLASVQATATAVAAQLAAGEPRPVPLAEAAVA